jgi:hypothetical protein
MKTVKRLVSAFFWTLVVGIIVINPSQSAFADVTFSVNENGTNRPGFSHFTWLPASAGSDAIVDGALAQVNACSLQLDLLKTDGTGYAQSNLFYKSGSIPLGSTRSEIQGAEDDVLSQALATIDLSDQLFSGRWFRVLYGGDNQEPEHDGYSVFGWYYKFQLDVVDGKLKIPATAYQVDLVGATIRHFTSYQEQLDAKAKTPKLGVSVVSTTSEVTPLRTSLTAPVALSRAIQIRVSGKPGSTVKIYRTPSYGDINLSRNSLVATIVLDDSGNGEFLDRNMLSVGGFYSAVAE